MCTRHEFGGSYFKWELELNMTVRNHVRVTETCMQASSLHGATLSALRHSESDRDPSRSVPWFDCRVFLLLFVRITCLYLTIRPLAHHTSTATRHTRYARHHPDHGRCSPFACSPHPCWCNDQHSLEPRRVPACPTCASRFPPRRTSQPSPDHRAQAVVDRRNGAL